MIAKGLVGWIFLLFVLGSCTDPRSTSSKYFHIQVIDKASGQGIPMVEIFALNNHPFYSDSYGNIAFHEMGLMNREVYFQISSPGYYYPKDHTGRSSIILDVREGGMKKIVMKRAMAAERIYRSTGLGIYNHTQLLGLQTPLKKATINAGILGQDSNLSAIYKQKIFWIWGDSFLPHDYHGNFAVSAATSPLPQDNPLATSIGIDYEYFVDSAGNTKNMMEPDGPGYIWFDWLMNIKDDQGSDRLIAKFARVNAYFGNYERGTAIFNDSTQLFERYKNEDDWLPEGHSTTHPFLVESNGDPYFYLYNDQGFSRVKPSLENVSTASAYEYFTCLSTSINDTSTSNDVLRNQAGEIIYTWKKDLHPINVSTQNKLIEQSTLKPSEALLKTYELVTGLPIDLQRGSIRWNEYRQRWIMIMGTKDIYYLEADTPVGPWTYASKVASLDNFYYNPVHHDFLDEGNGQFIYFEGTYTRFWGQGKIIPHYDYNQIMHRLDLSHPNVQLPLPVYLTIDGNQEPGYNFRRDLINGSNDPDDLSVPFYALEKDNRLLGTIPIFKTKIDGITKLTVDGSGSPFFYGISPQVKISALYPGTWDAKFNFASFDNFCSITLSESEGTIMIETERSGFDFSAVEIINDTLKFQLDHEERSYFLKGTITGGQIEGTCQNMETKNIVTWQAERFSPSWWGQFSPQVEPLYEYQNKETNQFHYSTEASLSGPFFIRSPDPICLVWKNPFRFQLMDFDGKPGNLKR